MKAIMKVIKPKTCISIMNLIQSILVIKNKREATAIQKLIDKNGFANIYVYCSKDIKNLLHRNCADIYWVEDKDFQNKNKLLGIESQPILNGKVPFKFRCYKVEDFPYVSDEYDKLIGSCLSEKELLDYSTISFENGIRWVKTIYAIHISNLEIFDKPKELSEFYKVGYLKELDVLESHFADIEGCDGSINSDYMDKCYEELDKEYQITKAPQNFYYIEEN